MMSGKAVTSRAFAHSMLREFGIALSSWPQLEPELPRKWLRQRGSRATITPEMADTTTTTPATEAPKRRGRAIRLEGPVTVAARNSGLSILEIAGALGASYGAAKAWNRRRAAPLWVRKALARAPYSVADTDWAE